VLKIIDNRYYLAMGIIDSGRDIPFIAFSADPVVPVMEALDIGVQRFT